MNEGNGRDDFSRSTVESIAKRSGYICAYPSCKRMTVSGSNDRDSGLTMTGVAAHITAASEKGPRYDHNMSQKERASEINGIWTCQIHGKFIDDNPSRCSVEELRRWKSQHEKWVFDRVESGLELFSRGVCRLSFSKVYPFVGEFNIPVGRNNVLVGDIELGITFCQILSALSGGENWKKIKYLFDSSTRLGCFPYIELSHQSDNGTTRVKISRQNMATGRRKADNARQRVHVEVNGCPSPDWPRSLFRVLYFGNQLYRTHYTELKDTFIKALRYLANVLGTDEDLIWDSLREELFSSSMFGNQFRRTGHRTVDIRVPGRDFFLPHKSLSFTEQQFAFLDIALKLVSCISRKEHWIYIFDTVFFERLDQSNKLSIFKKLTAYESGNVQTLFCLNSKVDADMLTNILTEKWVNAEQFEGLTLHSFL